MINYRDTKGGTIELPKLTLELSDKMDAVQAAQTNAERYALQHEFLRLVCGDDYCAQVLDGDSVDTIDLVELNVLYIGVVGAYSEPAMKAQAKAINEQMKGLKPAISAAEAVGVINRQGFNRVK